MTISNTLMNSILSMDSYNRGYNAGIVFGNNPGANNYSVDTNNIHIGTAVIYDSLGNQDAEDISFYGIAYTYNGDTIISYRGTDSFGSWTSLWTDGDIWNGWLIGGGSTQAKQAEMAFAFYHAVIGGQANSYSADVSFTGHSLGGGLAGMVAAIYGKQATVFDHMPYQPVLESIEHQTDPMDPDYNADLETLIYGTAGQTAYSTLSHNGAYINGEVLTAVRSLAGDTINVTGLTIGTDVDLTASQKHSVASLVITRFFVEEDFSGIGDWDSAAKYFWPVLYDDAFALSLGMDHEDVGGALQDDGEYSSILRTILAYSALDDGTLVFGDTGIRALYDDASDLGAALEVAGASATITAHATDISRALLSYAGLLALNEIEQAEHANALAGILTHDSGLLSVDLTDAAWEDVATETQLNDVKQALASALLSGTAGSEANAIERVVFAGQSGATMTLTTGASDSEHALWAVGSEGNDTITVEGINILAYGKDGDDVFTSSIFSGNTYVFDGGAGFDTVDYEGAGESEIEITWLAANHATDNLGNELWNVEELVFDGDDQTLLIDGGVRGAQYDGGAGIDTILYSTGIIYDRAAGKVYDLAGNTADTITGFEIVESTGPQAIIPQFHSGYAFNNEIPYFNPGQPGGILGLQIGSDTVYDFSNLSSGIAQHWMNHTGTYSAYYNDLTDLWSVGVSAYASIEIGGGEYRMMAGGVYFGEAQWQFDLYNGFGGLESRLHMIGTNHGDTISFQEYSYLEWFGGNSFYYNINYALGTGNDTVNLGYARGDLIFGYRGGHDVIHEANHVDTINVWGGISRDVVTVTHDEDSVLLDAGSFGSLSLEDITSTYSFSFQFESGGSITVTDSAITYHGTSGIAEELYGTLDDEIFNALEDQTINAGLGNDTLYGSSGTNILNGGAGDDTIETSGSGTVRGADGYDQVTLGSASSTTEQTTAYGDNGDDVFTVLGGTHQLYGGAGSDHYDISWTSVVAIADADGSNSVVIDIEQDRARFEVIEGTLNVYDVGTAHVILSLSTPEGFADLEFADSEFATIADLLQSPEGSHSATQAADVLDLSENEDAVQLYGLGGSDILTGSVFADHIFGGAGDDDIFGGDGDDVLDGGSGTNEIWGGGGNDTIYAYGGHNNVYAGSGNDVVYIGQAGGFVRGGDGADRFAVLEGARSATLDDFSYSDRLDLTAFSTIRSIEDLEFEDTLYGLAITAADPSIKFSILLKYYTVSALDQINFRFYGAPDALDDAANLTAGQTSIIDVLDNDDETLGAPLILESTTLDPVSSLGSVAINLDNTLSYTPRAGFTGFDWFSYTVVNGDGFADIGRVSVTVLNAGGEIFYGQSEVETLNGGNGDDFIFAYGGEENIANGLDGDDYINIVAVGGTVNGGSGTDMLELAPIFGSGIVVNIAAGSGYELGEESFAVSFTGVENLMGSYANDVLTGDTGNNTLVGNTGDDTLDGGDGIDTVDYRNFLYYNSSAVIVNLATGTAADATDSSTDTLISIENVIGGVAGDDITGSSGANVLHGMEGNDTLEGGAGNDTLDGGDGIDTARYANTASAVTVNLSTGTATGGDGSDTLTGIENVIGSAYADSISGDAGINALEGGDGADTIYGAQGADELSGGSGDDTLYGDNIYGTPGYSGAGNDLIHGDAGEDLIAGGDGDDEIHGGDDDDELYGNAGADELRGGLGNDVLYGDNLYGSPGYTGAGNDLIYGDEGEDTVAGGDGDDEIHGGDDDDSLYGNAGADLIYGDAGGDDLYGGTGDDTLHGGAGIDIMRGEDGADTLFGGDDGDTLVGDAGNDILRGEAGADTLHGEEGDDELHGGDANDILYGDFSSAESGSDGNDTIYGDAGNDTIAGRGGNDTLYGGADTDTMYGGSGADTLYGEAGTDTLYGDAGSDILRGGDGNDTLLGGADDDTLYADDGFDSLWGQGGNDIFVFAGETAFNNVDRIRDFASGDKINIADVLSDFGYDSGIHSLNYWVSITTSGGIHNYVAIDRDGAGSTYTAFTNMALVENYTALNTSDLITV